MNSQNRKQLLPFGSVLFGIFFISLVSIFITMLFENQVPSDRVFKKVIRLVTRKISSPVMVAGTQKELVWEPREYTTAEEAEKSKLKFQIFTAKITKIHPSKSNVEVMREGNILTQVYLSEAVYGVYDNVLTDPKSVRRISNMGTFPLREGEVIYIEGKQTGNNASFFAALVLTN